MDTGANGSDGAVGAEGAVGATGPADPIGPQGPASTGNIASSKPDPTDSGEPPSREDVDNGQIYWVKSSSYIGEGFTEVISANCEHIHDIALSGGCSQSIYVGLNFGLLKNQLVNNHRNDIESTQECQYLNTGNGPHYFTSAIYCIKAATSP